MEELCRQLRDNFYCEMENYVDSLETVGNREDGMSMVSTFKNKETTLTHCINIIIIIIIIII